MERSTVNVTGEAHLQLMLIRMPILHSHLTKNLASLEGFDAVSWLSGGAGGNDRSLCWVTLYISTYFKPLT